MLWRTALENGTCAKSLSGPERAEILRRAEAYWEREDAYFAGDWWQSEKKVMEASCVLLTELQTGGSTNLIELQQEYERKGKTNNRILLLQALSNVQVTGSYGANLQEAISTQLSAEGIDYGAKNLTVDEETVEALTRRYGQYKKPSGMLNSPLRFAQDIYGVITDLEQSAKREENKAVNDTLSLSQFPDALTKDGNMYIADQNKLGRERGFLFADSNVSDMGCGAVGVYNALHALGSDVSFTDVLYGTDIGLAGGGANILVMAEYMEEQGHQVEYLFGNEIDHKGADYDAVIVSCANTQLQGHFYAMIPMETRNQEGENLYHFYNGYGGYEDTVATYEDGVINPGKTWDKNIHLAIAIKK